MRTSLAGRLALALVIGISVSSCGDRESTEVPRKAEAVAPKAAEQPLTVDQLKQLRDEIPPDQLAAVMNAHYRGLGAMERYEYPVASEAFREVHAKAPGWIPGSINLAIALLNQGGEVADRAKAAGQQKLEGAPKRNIDDANRLLDEVLVRQPDNPWALYSRGIILQYESKIEEAHRDFQRVTELDPGDAHAWLELGSTTGNVLQEDEQARRKRAAVQAEIFTKALECNPYLVPALFKLSESYRFMRDGKSQLKAMNQFKKMNPQGNAAASGERGGLVYNEMGRYANVINPFPVAKPPEKPAPPPRFDVPTEVRISLPEGHRWAVAADFNGPLAVVGRVRARFGQGVATFDADGDGKLDLYLTAGVVGPKGVHDVLLLNRGEGRYEDATAAFGLPDDRAGLGVAAGDFDADRRLDLFLTGVGNNRLYRNVGGKFEDVTKVLGPDASTALSLSARWLDLDQDGDLDLYVLNYGPAADAERAFVEGATPAGLANLAYRNDGKPTLVGNVADDNAAPVAMAADGLAATEGLSLVFSNAFPGLDVLGVGKGAHTGLAALDIDEDRDIDLVVAIEGEPPVAILNDRNGAFHVEPLKGVKPDGPVAGLLVADLDKDGRPDLVAVEPGGRASAWRNATTRLAAKLNLAFESIPIDARMWRGAQALDLDLDTWVDLVGLPIADPALGLGWARGAGPRLETRPLALGPDGSTGQSLQGFAAADVVGDALPDLILVREGLPPRIARNLGNGQHWLSVDLAGRWKTSFDHMRTNSQGIGARLTLEGQGLNVPYDHTTTSASLAQSVGPVVLGMGSSTSAPLLRIRWPDGVMQCELNVTADRAMTLVERSRKTGSCPVLFTWNGSKFECLGDFLGGGGLGYLVSPGVYGQPDRDESVAIAPHQLKAIDGVYHLSAVEPMDEVAYLDKLTLDVVDRPPGFNSTPDERFAPEGPRPTGEIIAWSKAIEPAKAVDHEGQDVTREIRAWDRRTVDRFSRLRGWIGYTEDHSLILDFEDRLASHPPDRKLVLCLAGWVEYPYSQTNYAASTAGVALRPPILERQKPDGTWEVINPHPGYPAGLPRMMTVDLTGLATGPRCVLRLTTNMELYWDQAFVAVPEATNPVRTTSLPANRATLGDRGYLREVSPDGRQPLLYEYDYVDPAPLARMEGTLTRFGDVLPLLTSDDDHVCTVGPGDEARLGFDARGLPPLPEGWTRSYVLRAIGYCKDADPFTAGSDSVEPLPWRAMPPYPFTTRAERPADPEYSRYLREYQTRPAGVR